MHKSAGKIGHGTGCGDATTSGEPKGHRQTNYVGRADAQAPSTQRRGWLTRWLTASFSEIGLCEAPPVYGC